MEFNRHISRRLHEEHQATLALWGRLEASLAVGKPDAALMRRAAASLAEEIDRHFTFEEVELFPRLAAAGEGDIATLLAEEHAVIREAARRFIEVVRADPSVLEARALGLELAERLVSHVQKEEMSMLPALDDLLDEQADEQLTTGYVMS
jgi:DUF438 domain-containing protein